jgi:hypothetical protein
LLGTCLIPFKGGFIGQVQSKMADIGIPHPLDPDWKWKEFAKQEQRAQGRRRLRWLLGNMARINRPLAFVGCETRHVGGGEFHLKLGPMRVRMQRLG